MLDNKPKKFEINKVKKVCHDSTEGTDEVISLIFTNFLFRKL